MNENSVLLVGAGPMAIEYAKVLKDLNRNIVVVGRSERSARDFYEKTNIPVISGGIEKWISKSTSIPEFAIIAVTSSELGNVAMKLIKFGIKNILLEKPGGLTAEEINDVAKLAKENNSNIKIAYNRRYYASVIKAREIMKEDGGIESFKFEFTEWSHKIKDLQKAPGIKENWFLNNSTHVIDLAFYLGGFPKEMICYSCGGFDWHPIASIFVGSGRSDKGALFSYHANWGAPGRWWVEVLSKKHRLIFKPLEKLKIQEIGSITINEVEIDDSLDNKFKPGLYLEVEDFLTNKKRILPSIHEQVNNVQFYNEILNGSS